MKTVKNYLVLLIVCVFSHFYQVDLKDAESNSTISLTRYNFDKETDGQNVLVVFYSPK